MIEIITDKPFPLSEDTTRTRWLVDGELHRLDGPAIEWVDGGKEWWLNGQRHTESKYNKLMLMVRDEE